MEHGLPRRSSSALAPLTLIGSLIGALVGACKADQPALTDAHYTLDGRCIGPYADRLIDSFPSTLAMPNAVLGMPDNVSTTLLADDVVTVAFNGIGAITNADGADLRIHATAPDGSMALVRVAGLDQQFVYGGMLTPTSTDFDIGVSMLPEVVYVRVLGVQGSIAVDAFEAIHDMCR
jgi:hypothetical protein